MPPIGVRTQVVVRGRGGAPGSVGTATAGRLAAAAASAAPVCWAVSTRSATGAGVRLGRAGRGGQVLLEDLARGAVAEATARGVVEPVGEVAEPGPRERLGLAVAGAGAAGAGGRGFRPPLLAGGGGGAKKSGPARRAGPLGGGGAHRS